MNFLSLLKAPFRKFKYDLKLNKKFKSKHDDEKFLHVTNLRKYGISIDKNSVHGSDSIDNAKKEINFFFKD